MGCRSQVDCYQGLADSGGLAEADGDTVKAKDGEVEHGEAEPGGAERMPPEELEAFNSMQQFLVEARAAGCGPLLILVTRALGNWNTVLIESRRILRSFE